MTTGADGLAVLTGIQPGSYKVQEIKVPEGVILDPTPQTVEVVAGNPTTLTFVTTMEGGLKIVKTVEQTGEPLEGVTFRIEKPDGGLIGEYTTDEQGQIFVVSRTADGRRAGNLRTGGLLRRFHAADGGDQSK